MATTLEATLGRTENRAGAGSAKKDAPKNFWRTKEPDLRFGRDRWKLRCLRGGQQALNIGGVTTSIEWDDSSAVMTGSITLQRPDPAAPQKLHVGEGHVVVLSVDATGNGAFKELWRMRCSKPQVSAGDKTITLELQSDLALLQRSEDTWDFRKDKKHPKGWYAHQIVKEVCKRYGIRMGTIARGKHRIKKLHRDARPMDIITLAYKQERTATGKRYVISFRGGKLQVASLRRSKYLLRLAGTLTDATISSEMREDFATVVTVRGTAAKSRKNKGRRKIVKKIKSKKLVARYGYIHKVIHLPSIDSVAEANKQGKRWMAKHAKPKKEVTLTHPGLPFLRRGDALKIALAEEHLKQIVYVTEVRHSLSAGEFTSEIVVQLTDPYVDKKAEAKAKRKAAAAKRRKRKAAASAAAQTRSRPTTNDNRYDSQ